MRIFFANTSRPKSIASKLREALTRRGIGVPLRRSLEVAARIYGYRDWNQLCATVGTAPPSPSDLQLPPEDVAERLQYQVRALVEALQIGIPAATAIIDDIKPTCSRIPQQPSASRSSEWLLQAIRTGDLSRALEKAALGIAAVGQVHFHRMFSFDAGFFYSAPWRTDDLAEHVLLHSRGGMAFRAPWFEQDYVWDCRDRAGAGREFKKWRPTDQDDIGDWAAALTRMGAYAEEAVGKDTRETAKRVLEVLGKLNFDIIASLAVFDSAKFLDLHRLMDSGGYEDPVSWFYGIHPAFLDYILRPGKNGEKRDIGPYLERHPGDNPAAFADYAGDTEGLRRRAVRFLNKAGQSYAVANAFNAFATSKVWLSDPTRTIPYDQDDFDRRFAWLDERLHGGLERVQHPERIARRPSSRDRSRSQAPN